VDLAEHRAHQPPEHLGIPERDRAEEGEQAAAEEHVMDVRHHEIRVVEEHVHGRGGDEDAAQPPDHEHADERHGVQHRHVEVEVSLPHRGEPVERLDR
jgi:hypothetical protein